MTHHPHESERKRVELPDQSGANAECPECGCRHWLTVSESRGKTTAVRQRKCRNCGESDEIVIKLEVKP